MSVSQMPLANLSSPYAGRICPLLALLVLGMGLALDAQSHGRVSEVRLP